jgi:Putative transposase of IS4/5 family (DUF4096)
VRLSCAEIRRLFWQLVLLVERSATAILRWSGWRRWHQAWARYYHYRRREEGRRPDCSPGVSEEVALGAGDTDDEDGASDLVEQVWQRLQPLLPSGKRGGRPYSYDRRVIVEAIVHQRQTGCAWNALPSHFPPYQTVHTQLRNWQKSGLWRIAWDEELEQPCPIG